VLAASFITILVNATLFRFVKAIPGTRAGSFAPVKVAGEVCD